MLGTEPRCNVENCHRDADEFYVIQSMTGREGGIPLQLHVGLCAAHSRRIERNRGWNAKFVDGRRVTYTG